MNLTLECIRSLKQFLWCYPHPIPCICYFFFMSSFNDKSLELSGSLWVFPLPMLHDSVDLHSNHVICGASCLGTWAIGTSTDASLRKQAGPIPTQAKDGNDTVTDPRWPFPGSWWSSSLFPRLGFPVELHSFWERRPPEMSPKRDGAMLNLSIYTGKWWVYKFY